jgi:ATP-binding cassette, subfamily F, member 3
MISLDNISVNIGVRNLLDEVTLRISGKDRISLIGANGAGKSTLLKILYGIYDYDSGNIIKSKHTTLGYLPQETVRLSGNILYDELYESAEDIIKIEKELKEIESELSSYGDKNSDDYLDLLTAYSELQDDYEMLEGHKLDSKIEKILIGLGFEREDFGKSVEIFSGGWQMRIELAKLLLKNPTVLLLDEPTNHLDFETLVWFEKYLMNYKGALVLVSHDKKFLDNISQKTAEIAKGILTLYAGNYSYYVTEKAKRKELQESQYKNQQKYLEQQEKFIERFRYKATKARAVQSRIKMLEKIERVEVEKDDERVRFSFPPAMHSGRIMMEIGNLAKSYDGIRNVLENVDFMVERGEKIAIVGRNGAGKSTLTRILAGLEKYNSGSVKKGYNVKIKYFAQNQAEELPPELTVLQTLEEVNSGLNQTGLRNILGGFLFHGDDVDKKVGVLSGGEKSRLALSKMLIEPSNLLILDEPTNHLDMRSKEVLQDALVKYEGAVIIVSHDREFIDAIINKIVEVKNGCLKTYLGKSSEYMTVLEMQDENDEKEEQEPVTGTQDKKSVYKESIENKKRKKEFTKVAAPIKKRISLIERELNDLERKKVYLEKEMSRTDFFKDADFAVEMKHEYLDISEKIDSLTKDWETETENLNELEKTYK